MKKAKGFTLIECLVALAILGITSLLLAQTYTAILKLSNNTSNINYSLNQQTSDAELKANAEDITDTTSKFKMTLTAVSGGTITNASTYEIDTSVYMVKAHTVDNSGTDVSVSKGTAYEDDGTGTDVRYIYFTKKS
ncbi:MAG: prepilin-type N-terminal cleavage/methylation domain-containing protein [Oscillospiraceae bacterium]|nr:prepilin-type N-terminal cleavage/methylation domain-containing protein [Oscillospiraceae bacterium]